MAPLQAASPVVAEEAAPRLVPRCRGGGGRCRVPLHPPGMVVKQAADVLITSHVVRHTRGGVPRLGTGANLGFRSKGAGFRVRELGPRGKEMKGG